MARRWTLIAVLAVSLLAPPAAAQETVTADIAPTATLVGEGEAVDLTVTVTCPKKHDVLEAFVYVTQDGYTSQFAGIGIGKCKGKPVTYTVRVRPLEQPFHRGDASASSYVLVYNEDQSDTISGGEFQPLTII
ncbi:MAG TPA: hypothetical protein VHI71_07550 [Actinomycetota bacterium]|nr:hypothetical protein [Actinomycetota bacterium]